MKKRDRKLAIDLVKQVLKDPAYEQRAPLRQAAKDAAAPVLYDLGASAIVVDNLTALRPSHPQIKLAVPILAKWLPQIEHPWVRMTIVRRLSIPAARGLVSDVLIGEFEKIRNPDDSLKWAIGNALSITAVPADLSRLLSLAKRRTHGRAREMIVLGLANFDTGPTRNCLVQLLDDDDVNGHALIALRKLRAVEAKAVAKHLTVDDRGWVRKEAKRFLEMK